MATVQAAPPGLQVQFINNQKGKGLFATKSFKEGDILFEEYPIVSCQFAWNKAYKYLSCDLCMRPLETAEQNVRRLATQDSITLPYGECCNTSLNTIVQCDACGTKYCTEKCKVAALQLYHQTLCHNENDSSHPLEILLEAWKQVHFPPESANIMLIVRILAMIRQSQDSVTISQKFKQFTHRTVSEDSQLVHKLLGDKFIGQLEMFRELTTKAMFSPVLHEFLTPEGFSALMALVGTNGQGIGTSPMAQWVNNVSVLQLLPAEKSALDKLIDQLYDHIEKESGTFLNTEGSGLYELQSVCNHSCVPNAEPGFPYGNHCMQLKAVRNINVGDEVFISYIDECMLVRSRHSRQKELASNYLFSCACEKCMSQIDDPNETSADEMSEDSENYEDMSD